MLQKGTARKVTIFVNEDTQHHFNSLCDSVLTFLLHKGVSGATATRAMAGFGAHQVMHTTKIEVLTEHLPIRIEFIESAEKVDELMPTLYDMVTDGVIEVQDTQVVKVANKERSSPPKGPHTETRGTARLMRIYMGESDKWQGECLYEAVVKRLRSMDMPVMISVVDSDEKLAKAVTEIESMMQDGIIVFSDVDVIRLVQSRPAAEVSRANG
jgi:PII-like signaling protein